MKRALDLKLVPVVFAGVLVVALAAGFASSKPQRSSVLPGVYTYAEAVALGIPTLQSPDELGLPACWPDRAWKGFATAEEAAKAVAVAPDEPTCAADPRTVLYGVNLPVPAPASPPGGAPRPAG